MPSSLIGIVYPESVTGSDLVSRTYNRLGQQASITDRRGNVRTLYFDKLGRLTGDAVSTVGSGTDSSVAVCRIALPGMPRTARHAPGGIIHLCGNDSSVE